MSKQPNLLLAALLLATTACSQTVAPPSPAQANIPHALYAPLAMSECEGDQCARNLNAVWTFHGAQGEARWPYGAAASLSVERFDAQGIVIRRTDLPASSSPGLTAVYKGTPHGNVVDGTATWIWPGHFGPVNGVWHGVVPVSLADQQGLIDAQKKALADAQNPVPLTAEQTQQLQALQSLVVMGLAGAMAPGDSSDSSSLDAAAQRDRDDQAQFERSEQRIRNMGY